MEFNVILWELNGINPFGLIADAEEGPEPKRVCVFPLLSQIKR